MRGLKKPENIQNRKTDERYHKSLLASGKLNTITSRASVTMLLPCLIPTQGIQQFLSRPSVEEIFAEAIIKTGPFCIQEALVTLSLKFLY